RCRLKTVEESFANSDLIRCHRKYIINIAKVQVLHKEKDGYHADLGIESIVDVPVSKTYEAAVLGRFNSR
ncbi:MAG: LytTR family transcriptional regulator, partial [Bacteroidales bacterium]|nr:LytTR family transcriptional regulator [Bacteroidales bacterium]